MAPKPTRAADSSDVSRILIVDEDPIVAASIADTLGSIGYDTQVAPDGAAALETLESAYLGVAGGPPRPFAVLICDMATSGLGGLELIKTVRERHRDLVPIAITGYGTIEAAVKAIRHGAIDYLTKPLVDDELRIAVEKALRQQALLRENTNLRQQLDQRYGFDNIVGNDRQMRRLFDLIGAVATSKTTVLMCGESGTGKSMIARAIHHHSPLADAPFVEISCGSIPETLLESELFGHVKGAFTGAHSDKPGRFLAAHGGTLFLDEINAASPGMQLKLLRVLQERTFEPVGSNEPVEVDVRVILASNQPLEDLVARGEFRQDLYYRINVVNIPLIPLRQKREDIPLLVEFFLHRACAELEIATKRMAPEMMEFFLRHSWPGNVRQLQNVINACVILSREPILKVEDIPEDFHEVQEPTPSSRSLEELADLVIRSGVFSENKPLEENFLATLSKRLVEALGSKAKAARMLGISKPTLYRRLRIYDKLRS